MRLPTVDRAAFETGVLPFLRLHAAEPMQDIPRVRRLRGGCGGALGLGLGSGWAWFGFEGVFIAGMDWKEPTYL